MDDLKFSEKLCQLLDVKYDEAFRFNDGQLRDVILYIRDNNVSCKNRCGESFSCIDAVPGENKMSSDKLIALINDRLLKLSLGYDIPIIKASNVTLTKAETELFCSLTRTNSAPTFWITKDVDGLWNNHFQIWSHEPYFVNGNAYCENRPIAVVSRILFNSIEKSVGNSWRVDRPFTPQNAATRNITLHGVNLETMEF